MGKKISAPPPIDVEKTAAAQAAANKEAVYASADVSSANQYSPWGAVTYVKDDRGVPLEQHTNLTPGTQYIFDQQLETAGGLGDIALAKMYQVPLDNWDVSHLPNDPATARIDMDRFNERSLGREASFNERGLSGTAGRLGSTGLKDWSNASFFGNSPAGANVGPTAASNVAPNADPNSGPLAGDREAMVRNLHSAPQDNEAFMAYANPRATQTVSFAGDPVPTNADGSSQHNMRSPVGGGKGGGGGSPIPASIVSGGKGGGGGSPISAPAQGSSTTLANFNRAGAPTVAGEAAGRSQEAAYVSGARSALEQERAAWEAEKAGAGESKFFSPNNYPYTTALDWKDGQLTEAAAARFDPDNTDRSARNRRGLTNTGDYVKYGFGTSYKDPKNQLYAGVPIDWLNANNAAFREQQYQDQNAGLGAP